MPSRCFWLQFCSAQFTLGKLEVLLELHAADTSDDGQHFSPLSAAFFGLLFGVEALRYRVMPIHLARVRNNQNHNQNNHNPEHPFCFSLLRFTIPVKKKYQHCTLPVKMRTSAAERLQKICEA